MYTNEDIIIYREKIITEAKKMLKVPFFHRGNTKYGVDCRGFVWRSYNKAGFSDIPSCDGKSYESNWFMFADRERYLDFLLVYCDWTYNPQMGDIPVFKCYSDIVTHAGIHLNDDTFIHAPSGREVRIEKYSHRYWRSKFAGWLIYKPFNVEEK